MKLSIDFRRLIKARESIGADPATVGTVTPQTPDYKNPFEAQLLEQGRVILTWAEFSENIHFPAGLAAIGNQQLTLHIYEPNAAREDLEKLPSYPKYHLCDCETLETMRLKKRFDRYIALRDGQDILPVRPKNIETGQWEEEIKVRLLPCKNCLKQLEIHVNHMEFNLQEFFDVNKPIFRCLPLYNRENYPDGDGSGGYTKDFSVISKKLRERANWCCSQCTVNLSQKQDRALLHVHHIDGVRGNNRSDNLRVLCILCHQKQPFHGHMQIRIPERQRIETLRKQINP